MISFFRHEQLITEGREDFVFRVMIERRRLGTKGLVAGAGKTMRSQSLIKCPLRIYAFNNVIIERHILVCLGM